MAGIKIMREFYCEKCGSELPVRVHYKNRGLVMTFCEKCGKCCYINDLKILKDKK